MDQTSYLRDVNWSVLTLPFWNTHISTYTGIDIHILGCCFGTGQLIKMLSPRQHWSLSSHQDRDQSDWTWCKMVQIMYWVLFLWVWPHVWWTLNVSLLSAKHATKEPQSRTHILGHKPANAGAQSHFRFGWGLMINKKCRAQLKRPSIGFLFMTLGHVPSILLSGSGWFRV